MSNIKFTMKDLDGTVMPYASFVISTSTSANAASFTTNLNGEATVSLAAVSTPYYISKQDGTTESVIAYKFFVPDAIYTLDAELLFVDMGKISKDKNDKSIAALIEAKVVAVNAANRALQVVSLLGDVSTIRTNLTNLVQVASNLTSINAVNANATNITTVASNTTNINKVATIDANVTTVANSQASVNTVATNIANVNTVAPNTANIGAVATNIRNVSTVAGSITSVNTTASNIANVNTVAGNTSNISTVAGINPAVTTVANNIEDIQATAEGIGLIPVVLPYTSNITTVANNIAPIIAVGNNINNINEVRAMEADIEVLADEIANIAGAAAAVTQAVDAQKDLFVTGTHYTKNSSNSLSLTYFPAKSNSVKIFFDGTYKNKDTWNRVGKNIAFTSVINADKVEIQYEVPSSFVGLSPEDILVIQNAEAAALASEVDAQQSATAAAVSASLAQGVVNQAVDAIKQLFVAGVGFTKGVSTQLTMDFTPVKTNAVKVFFEGVYQNKDTFTRVGKVITFNEAINVDNVEIHYEVPSQFVGLDDDDNAVLVAAQNAAQASANAAAQSLNNFDDRYLGAKPIPPTVDNDGNAIIVGAKYFNITESKMYVRNASNTWQMDTADSGGVNYLPSGSGALAMTVQTKLSEHVSVKDFGAVGDGVADDSTAIQAALNTGKAVYIPKGVYKLNTPITLATIGQRLFGENSQATYLTGGLTHDLVRVAASHCEVDHIHFRPSGYSDASPAVFAPLRVYAALAFIHDNRFLAAAEGHGTAILLDDVNPVTTGVVAGAYTHLIENNRIGTRGYSFLCGIFCFNGNNGQQATKFQNNQILGDLGIYVHKGGGNYYVGNLLQSATGGYGIGTRVGNAIDLQPNVTGETITGNYIERYQNGIMLRRAAADYLVANVYGNHFDKNEYNLFSTGSSFYRFINDERLTIMSNGWQESFNSQDDFKLYNREGVEVYNINRVSVSFEPKVLAHNQLQTLAFSSNGSAQTPSSSWCEITGYGAHRTGCFLGNGRRNGQHLYIRAHSWSVQILNNPGGVQNIHFANNAANATFGQSGNIGTMHLIWDSTYASGRWFEMGRTVA